VVGDQPAANQHLGTAVVEFEFGRLVAVELGGVTLPLRGVEASTETP
jgi:hypothetical protein